MTPTPAWYEADADDSDRNGTDDVAANTQREPRGAILPAVEPARGFSDADLLRKRTAALNRTSAENERLRAEVERLRDINRELVETHNLYLGIVSNAEEKARVASEAKHDACSRAEAAEAGLRDVAALGVRWADEFDQAADAGEATPIHAALLGAAQAIDAVLARSQAPQEGVFRPIDTELMRERVQTIAEHGGVYDADAELQLRRARSQAPQEPAEQEGRPARHNHLTRDIKPLGQCPACDRYHAQHAAPSPRPATANDEPHAEFGEEFCALSKRVDGKRHTWRFDGDDPYIVCHWCDEVRDARTGRVVREANDSQDVLGDNTADDEGVRRG